MAHLLLIGGHPKPAAVEGLVHCLRICRCDQRLELPVVLLQLVAAVGHDGSVFLVAMSCCEDGAEKGALLGSLYACKDGTNQRSAALLGRPHTVSPSQTGSDES